MTATRLVESGVEEATLAWLAEVGWQVAYGPDIDPEKLTSERDDFSEVVLTRRLARVLERINPELPPTALEHAIRAVLRVEHPSLIENNRRFHRLLVEGVDVEVKQADGSTRTEKVWLVDFDRPYLNDFMAVNQFTVVEAGHKRRPDVVLFVNGLPLCVIELKNPSEEKATALTAFHQLQTYRQEIPSLFQTNELLVVSDGLETRAGTLTADWERFAPWRTIDGEGVEPPTTPGLETLVRGLLAPGRLLDLIRYFVVFEDDGVTIAKKLAAYHQYWAVNKAVGETLRAVDQAGDRRIGVVWHTQGSGKSLSMAFYAGKVIAAPELRNPTVVVITDRNDLDDQLYGTFCGCQELLRQSPVQAESRDDLRAKLKVASGGVVFTTIQKFLPQQGEAQPELSARRNIVVVADEAHRSQYDFIRGFARNMRDALPNASFIGFTGTPIELADRNTRTVFGNYIDTYDIERAVQDGATVPIYYEARLQKIELDEAERPRIDPDFEEVTEAEECERREKLKSKWARLEALVGSDKRIKLIAADLVEHFEQRLEAIEGKAMVVCMSRRICVALHDAIAELHPEWVTADDASGVLKVVMTGSAPDPVEWQPHIRSKARREALALRFKDPTDPFKIVIVRDMWLTGFDAPSLHTMYVDKPMRGHGLMQAIARVNRVFRGKPGGLVVDYIGLADQLKRAVATYTESGGAGDVAVDQAAAVAVMQEKYEIVCDLMFGFAFQAARQAMEPGARLALVAEAMEHVLEQENGKRRFLDAVSQLSKAFALAVPADAALAVRDDVGLFQSVRSALAKLGAAENAKTDEELDAAVRQIVSRAVVPEGWAYILDLTGGERKDISILDDSFLAEIRGMTRRNLAVELLERLVNDEIKTRSRRNLVESRSFSEMLAHTVDEYNNRTLTAEEALEKLIELAGRIKAARERGEKLGLNEEELAFYDALETNDSAVALMGDELLRRIAQELAVQVRRNASVDWSLFESSRARMRLAVKKLLRKYHYPPDKQEGDPDRARAGRAAGGGVEPMICPKCGQEASGHFCSNCGTPLSSAPATETVQATAQAATIPPPPQAPPPPAPSQTVSPPFPAAAHLPLCPVCCVGGLAVTEVKGALGLGHHGALVCSRCGAELVQDKHDASRFELVSTHDATLPNWRRYAHRTLSVSEWYNIAHGGHSDVEQHKADLAAAKQQQTADLAEAMAELREGRIRLAAAANSPVLLHSGEQAVFVLPNVSLHEPRSVTRGAYGGPSLHVAKGLTLRVGGFQAQSHEELKEIDSGILVLTNKRLCYAGRLRSIDVALTRLVSVDPYSDAVAIRRSGKEKTEFFFGLDQQRYHFTVQGRSYTEPMSGLIFKYAIEGLLTRG